MYRRSDEVSPVPMAEGIERRTLTHGEAMLLVEFTIRGGAVFPEHDHPHEQTGYLRRGRGRLWIGEDVYDLVPGSSWSIPGGMRHRAEFYEDSVAVDVFHPVREDYLDE